MLSSSVRASPRSNTNVCLDITMPAPVHRVRQVDRGDLTIDQLIEWVAQRC